MGYLVDRARALWTGELVAIVRGTQRRIRSRVVLKDNSLYQTLTRPATLRRQAEGAWPVRLGIRAPRGTDQQPKGRTRIRAWWTPQ